jgi:hypothetical protein
MLAATSQGKRQARADEGVAAEQDRDPGGRGRRRQRPEPGIVDLIGEQEVRREPVLGRRPAALIGTDVVCQQHTRIDDRRIPQSGKVVPERRGPVAVEERAQDRRSGPLVGRVRDAVRDSSQARFAAETRPAITSSARESALTVLTPSMACSTAAVPRSPR